VGAQHHADRRVDQLAADVLLVLDGDAGVRVERRRIDLIEAVPPRRDEFGRRYAGRREQPDRDRVGQPVDHVRIHAFVVLLDPRGDVAPLGVDVIDVAAGRFDDVAIG
jgi:hypothetical protein